MKSSQPRCILTDAIITANNNSKAHVIPNALGGWLKPKDILCKNANGKLGETVDKLLIEALGPIMTLIDGRRDRGSNQPMEMRGLDGTGYLVRFNKPGALAKPSFIETQVGETSVFNISARTPKEMKQLLGRVKARFPRFDVEQALAKSKRIATWPEGGQMTFEMEIGPRRTFPGIFTAANVFAAHVGLDIHPMFRTYIEEFDVEQATAPPDTFYFIQNPDAIPTIEAIMHHLAAVSCPRRGKTLVLIQLFDTLEAAVVLPYTGQDIRYKSYTIDVLTGQALQRDDESGALLEADWVPTHDLGSDIHAIFETRVGRLIETYQRRESTALLEKNSAIAAEKLKGPLNGATILNALAEPHTMAMTELTRPGRSETSKDEIIEGFSIVIAESARALVGHDAERFEIEAAKLVRQLEERAKSG